jgi:hypothetical protein
VDGAAVDAVRTGVALITALRSSPDDLPDLLLDLSLDPLDQALVANALLSRFAMTAMRDLSDASQTTLANALDQLVAGLPLDEAQDRSAWDGALRTARAYAEVLDGVGHPEAVAEELGKNLRSRLAAVGLIVALTQLTVVAIEARCDALGESTIAYLQRLALPAAEAHGNSVDADALDAYVGAVIEHRLASEPDLPTNAAQALRAGTVDLPDALTDEFNELGGPDKLDELTGVRWDDLDDDERRLIVLVLLDSVIIDPDGDLVADRVRITWRF